MQLFMSPPSPFVRYTRATIRELGLADAVEEVRVDTTPYTTPDALSAANPLGKIPVLVRDDGPALYDSRVICRYLDAASGGRLFPESRIWEVLTLEATALGIAEAAVSMVYEGRLRPEEKQHQPYLDAQWTKIARGLDAVGDRWMSHLAGPVDAAQIAMGCALAYLDFRHPDRGWRDGRPALAAWEAAFAERPSMIETRPE